MVAIENNDEFLRLRSPPKESSEFKLLFIVKTFRSANESSDVYSLVKKEGVFHLVGTIKEGRNMLLPSYFRLRTCCFISRKKKNASAFDLH